MSGPGFYQELLPLIFGQDQRFVAWRTDGIPESVRREVASFWTAPELEVLRSELPLAAADWNALMRSLEEMSTGRRKAGGSARWLDVAQRAERLAARAPEAGVVVALQALAAWVGALGTRLYEQPWTGHHPGWHVFPLVTARALLAARAIWSARFVCETAAGFVESAKQAPHDPGLRAVVAEYRSVLARVERVYDESVAELAWELAAAGAEGESFRPHLAALFWTVGDVLHAGLLASHGPPGYAAPYPLVRDLVDRCIRRLPRDPLIQYLWLEMKDRGPFDLRAHRELFGRINNVFRSHPLADLDALVPVPLARAYARVLAGYLGGRLDPGDRRDLEEGCARIGPAVEAAAPDVALRLRGLLTLLAGAGGGAAVERWRALAGMSASILAWAERSGIYEPFDRVLDAPFHHLPVHSEESLGAALDAIEGFRRANLGYWLAIAPPPPPDDPALEPLLQEEARLLEELRGGRFILMLPHLPRHYRRYGVRLDQAEQAPPPGAAPARGAGLLGFDPFDQRHAQQGLRQALEHLEQLYARMQAVAPGYAAVRAASPSSRADFVAALGAHRTAG